VPLLTQLPRRGLLGNTSSFVVALSLSSSFGNPLVMGCSIFTRRTIALLLREHIVKTTYLFVRGYLFLPLFTGLPRRGLLGNSEA
jgi:hypothetical protein